MKNTGKGKLVTDNETFQLFIDGELISNGKYNMTPSYIYPSDVAEIYLINTTVSSGTYQLRLVGPYAIADTLTFTV